MLILNGQSLTLKQIADVASGLLSVSLDIEALQRMEASRRVVEEITTSGRVVYGVNTGFGKLSC
jgi:histidine ammonia-lyase